MTGPAVRRLRSVARQALGAVGLERRGRRVEADRRAARAAKERDAARKRLRAGERDTAVQAARAQSLGAELDALRSAHDVASGRDRVDLRYLFVVTYGRSGSTLLQGLLNSAPGVMVRGENGGVLLDLYRLHSTATGHRDRLLSSSPLPPEHPWWGIDGYRDETAYRDVRTLLLETVLRPEPSTEIAGFKEIDWVRDDMPDALPGVLAFTRAVFPGARFVLNTRDLSDVAASKWWAGQPDALDRLRAMERVMVDALAPYGDDVHRVHYDDYVADPAVLAALFGWLGVDFDEAAVREVMAVRHSY
ncbi:MAG: sulfotransferase [Sporichthyaceae bacterium]